MNYFVGPGAGDTAANRASQRGRSTVTLSKIIAAGLREYGNSPEGAGSQQEDRVGHIATWLADRIERAIDGATLTLTPGVVLDMRADGLGKMIQARVRAGGLSVIRIEELETVAARLGIPLSELDGTSPASALSGTAA